MDPRLIAKELQVSVSAPERTLYFHGESMRPLLIEGDEVVVEPVAWDDIRLGDIITYRYLDRFPTRRVVRKHPDRLQLWCDNWPDRRFECTREDVLGRAVSRRRGAEWLASTDVEWCRAMRRARLRWEFRNARLVTLPRAMERARRAPRKLLRILGILPRAGAR